VNDTPGRLARKFGGLLVFLCVWEGVSRSGFVPYDYFPPVSAIAVAMAEESGSPKFLANLLTTWTRTLSGLAIALVLGLGLAVLAGSSQFIRRMLAPFVDMLRVLPPPAIVPISIFIFGLGTQLYLFIISFSALWPIYLNAANALSAPEPVQIAGARSMGYGDREILWKVRLPTAMPEIFTGIRLGAGIALLAAVASEMLASSSGLGALLFDAGFTLRVTDMFAVMFFVGISGILLNVCIAAIRSWAIGWHIGLAALGDPA
jgi:ABC-type nitrate/sulfonate/bicarbonate transport system permease component